MRNLFISFAALLFSMNAFAIDPIIVPPSNTVVIIPDGAENPGFPTTPEIPEPPPEFNENDMGEAIKATLAAAMARYDWESGILSLPILFIRAFEVAPDGTVSDVSSFWADVVLNVNRQTGNWFYIAGTKIDPDACIGFPEQWACQ